MYTYCIIPIIALLVKYREIPHRLDSRSHNWIYYNFEIVFFLFFFIWSHVMTEQKMVWLSVPLYSWDSIAARTPRDLFVTREASLERKAINLLSLIFFLLFFSFDPSPFFRLSLLFLLLTLCAGDKLLKWWNKKKKKYENVRNRYYLESIKRLEKNNGGKGRDEKPSSVAPLFQSLLRSEVANWPGKKLLKAKFVGYQGVEKRVLYLSPEG